MENSDKRIYPRSKAGFMVKYRLNEHMPVHKAEAFDVSATGLSFITAEPLSVGQKLEFNLNLKEMDKTIPGKGEVVRNHTENGQHICSVRITGIDYDDFISMLDYSLAFMEE